MTWVSRRSCTALLLLVMAMVSPPSAGQQTPPTAPRPPIFRLATEYVELDVRILDGKGQIVGDVGRDEVKVVEDGVPQTIDVFTPMLRLQRSTSPTATPGVSSGSADSDDAAPPVQRLFVLFLDDLQVDFQRTPQTIKLATEFIEQYLDADDLCAVMTSGGSSAGTTTLTKDRTVAVAAVKRFIGQKMEPESIATFRGTQPSTDAQRAFDARASLTALRAAVEALGTVRGASKSVVLFSEGLNYNYEEFRRPRATALLEDQEEAISAATIGNVALHVVDPRMLYANQELVALGTPAVMGRGAADNSSADTLMWRRLVDGFRNDVGRARSSLRSMATRTGGIIGIETNDMRPAFSRIIDATSGFYQIGYRSSNPRQPGKEHKVKVTVSRPKLRVIARSGYREPKSVRTR